MKQFKFIVVFTNGNQIKYSCYAADYAEALQSAKNANLGYKEIQTVY